MKEKIITFLFIITLFSGLILGIITTDKDVSIFERRKLTTYTNLKEDYISNLDDYMSDQFPLRDKLISLSTVYERYFLGNKGDKDVYIKDDYLIDKLYPLNDIQVSNFVKKMSFINESYLKNSNVYYSVIPDKSYFLNDDILKISYYDLFKQLGILEIPYIDITKSLELKDYYKTDIHIKQENYPKIIDILDKKLNFKTKNYTYKENTFNEFYGASFSKAPFTKPDTLTYLTNDIINNAKVKHLDNFTTKVYDVEELGSIDSYNVFLSGPSGLIEIENDLSGSDKELVIFRDSFASSLAPLLIPYYKKITLIDLRYINMDLVSNYVDFEDKDVLLIYSTLIINSSNILKVNIK